MVTAVEEAIPVVAEKGNDEKAIQIMPGRQTHKDPLGKCLVL